MPVTNSAALSPTTHPALRSRTLLAANLAFHGLDYEFTAADSGEGGSFSVSGSAPNVTVEADGNFTSGSGNCSSWKWNNLEGLLWDVYKVSLAPLN